MTIQEFIESAVEGGYPDPKPFMSTFIGIPPELMLMALNIMVLDPRAWKAVGKAKGWNEGNNQPEIHHDAYAEYFWQSAMYAMIHAIINGSTLEEYIATL